MYGFYIESFRNKNLLLDVLMRRVVMVLSCLVAVGVCCECGQTVTDARDATQALGQLYHSGCFSCFSCGRALKGKKFYEAAGRIYCEEDYLYSGFQQSSERCTVCGHFIMEMVTEAKQPTLALLPMLLLFSSDPVWLEPGVPYSSHFLIVGRPVILIPKIMTSQQADYEQINVSFQSH